MPGSSSVYTFRGVEGGTQVTYESTFDSLEGLKTVLDMGMVEGATSAMSQIDDLLAEE